MALLFRVRGEKPREIAVEILLTRHRGAFVESLVDSALSENPLSPEDRRFLQELVYGVVRWELTLDWLIGKKTEKPQKPFVQNLLRLALYQMFWLDRVPSYAAVNECVELCKQRGFVPQARFINAVLRGYGREMEETRQALREFRTSDLSRGFSHPAWLCKRWVERFGREKTVRLLDWNNLPAPTFARVNRLKINPAQLQERWRAENIDVEPIDYDWAPAATIFRLRAHPALATLPSFQEGLFYVQDPSTLLAVSLLGAQPGESVLDLCAAPGGKTMFIAERLENKGRIVALDLDPARLKLVQENAARLGASCVTTEAGEGMFDRVLLDVPCSNTGVMRRRLELRWRLKPEEVTRLAHTQMELLRGAAAKTKPGGVLVYSTCSIEAEENERVVSAFIKQNQNFILEQERALTPFADSVDGAYAARLRRAN